MRLIDTETLQLTTFDEESLPKYAILSHRWEEEEVSFQEFENGRGTAKRGYHKISAFCAEARRQGYKWCWVDTCGIDKTSSAELSEAINSMYKWYANSAVCFAYLSDVTAQRQTNGSVAYQGLESSRWFTRGWTLQEMIAPRYVDFYSAEWIRIGNKRDMNEQLNRITGVTTHILLVPMSVRSCSVAKIMSWASRRITTRKEDIAYCLLGLFGIQMPLLYGEGARAFIRLQEEILKHSSDQSIFVWNPLNVEKPSMSILAPAPSCFADTGNTSPYPAYWDTESTLTNRGIRTRMPIKYEASTKTFLGVLCCMSNPGLQDIAIELQIPFNFREDHQHVMRRATPVRYGGWLQDEEIRFNVVYLATEMSLLHAETYESRHRNVEPQFTIFVRNAGDFISSHERPDSYPAGDSITYLDARPEDELSKAIAVLYPLKSSCDSVALSLFTMFSRNVVLIVGFNKLPGDLPDLEHPWLAIELVEKHIPLQSILLSKLEKLPNGSQEDPSVEIDGIRISAKLGATGWWAKNFRNIVVSMPRR
jgi:hypothetical protein